MQLIVTADDFGASRQVNEAVRLAHHAGTLTSASLMVSGPGFDHAVEVARECPGLQVGLHLALAGAAPVLPRRQLRHLVDSDGRLTESPWRAGWRFLASRRCREELRREIRAQFERFAETGLPLSHVDGHMQLHMHPSVFDDVATMAEEYGAAGIRLPREPVDYDLLRHPVPGARGRVANAVAAGWLAQWCRRRLRGRALAYADRTFGLARSGWMTPAYVEGVLRTTSADSVEIYFHPKQGLGVDPHGPNPIDLQTLLDKAVRRAVVECGWRLGGYRELRGAGRPAA